MSDKDVQIEKAIEICKAEFAKIAHCYRDGTWEKILEAYTQNHRDYHDIRHIADLLSEFSEFEHLSERSDLIRHAIFFHDFIYDVRDENGNHRSDSLNVADSAKAFLEYAVFMPPQDRAAVDVMINSTNGHKVPDHIKDENLIKDVGLFLDMDLSSMALPYQEFWANTIRIRAEYAHVPMAQFCTGRAGILENFAKRDQLFFTPELDSWNDVARWNLLRSAQDLRKMAASKPALRLV